MKIDITTIILLVILSIVVGILSVKVVDAVIDKKNDTKLPDNTEVSYVIIEITKETGKKSLYGTISIVKQDTLYVGKEWGAELYKELHKYDIEIEQFKKDYWYLFKD